MEFEDVIKSRTSVRTYSNKDVEDEKIKYMLECAQLAPSWRNSQCWSFIVVKNKEKKKELSKTGMINKWLKDVPVIIVACGTPKISGTRNNMNYFLVDVAIAMQHLILAATDMGLGSCWIGGFNERKVKEILEIPDDVKVVALTPIGYPTQKSRIGDSAIKKIVRSKQRKNFDEIIHYEKW